MPMPLARRPSTDTPSAAPRSTEAIDGVAEQTEQTLAFLEAISAYNRAIAEYATAVLPPERSRQQAGSGTCGKTIDLSIAAGDYLSPTRARKGTISRNRTSPPDSPESSMQDQANPVEVREVSLLDPKTANRLEGLVFTGPGREVIERIGRETSQSGTAVLDSIVHRLLVKKGPTGRTPS